MKFRHGTNGHGDETGPRNFLRSDSVLAVVLVTDEDDCSMPTMDLITQDGLGPVNPNMVRNTRIDHNYFHDKALGSGEAIVLGGLGVTGDYQDTFSTIEYNVFQNCDGDAEIISVKSSSNALRYNTILTSNGTLSLRAGNRSSVYSNFMLQGGKSGAGGIKLYEMELESVRDNDCKIDNAEFDRREEKWNAPKNETCACCRAVQQPARRMPHS